MKITGITVHMFEPRKDLHQEVQKHSRRKNRQNGVVVVHTDEGIDGVVSGDGRRVSALAAALPTAAGHIIGQDVFDRPKIARILTNLFWFTGDQVGLIDYALWDIAGKAFNQPIYKLLGAARERVLAYASTVHHGTDEAFVETAVRCKEQGFKALKLHPYCIADDDIRMCRKVRAAVGDDMELMIDSLVYPGPYTRLEAARVAAVLDELNFYWFEDPLHNTDLDGLADLRRKCKKVQIRAADRTRDIREYQALVRLQCVDIIAGPSSFGITDLMKLAAFAELHGIAMEPHDFSGGTASLHVLLAITNGTYYEIAVPEGCFHNGIYPGVYLDPCWIDKDGYVAAPTKPGLGFGIDFGEVKKVTESVVRF